MPRDSLAAAGPARRAGIPHFHSNEHAGIGRRRVRTRAVPMLSEPPGSTSSTSAARSVLAAGFHPRGTPDAADWSFGLELERFGVMGSERALDEPLHACADGQRLMYDLSADLSEWWVNDARGLEHGYRDAALGVGRSNFSDAVAITFE